MLLLRLLLPLALALPFGLDDEVLKEFKRYFRKYKDSATRVEAVLTLEDTSAAGVPKALAPILSDADVAVRRAAIRVLGRLESPRQVQALLGVLVRESKPLRKSGLLQAIQVGGYPSAAALLPPLLEDSDWRVRRDAIAALARVSPEVAADALLALCEDSEVVVRCAAFDALGELRAPAVLEPALGQLDSRSWQVRASVIQVLGKVRHRDSIGPLIQRMALEEGRLVVDVGDALGEITGRTYGQRLEDWQRFWERFESRFEIPTDQELAKTRAARAKARLEYAPESEASVAFAGVQTPSQSILFVIDVSGSMDQEILERERYAGDEYEDISRMGIVKVELIRSIQRLAPDVKFNVISFATGLKTWKKSMVKANPVNKSSAENFVSRLKPIGGNSSSRLASVGLVGTADVAAGKTNTYAALCRALGVPLERGEKISHAGKVDTIFFLSDGRPSTGKYIELSDILREVKRENTSRKVVIHTLGIGDFEKGFMQRLAADSGGVFVDLGK